VAHLYYVPDGEALVVGEQAYLRGDEARHAVTVGRLARGQEILLGDGRGSLASARASDVSAREVALDVLELVVHEAPTPELWLVQALAKGDRDEMAIQACTELGVDRVIPWQASRSVSVWKGDKLDKGRARWQKIVTEASKQSLRPRVPVVDTACTTAELVSLAATHQVVLLDPEAAMPLSGYSPRLDTPVVIVVGPEGGIDPGERDLLVGAGAIDARLGSTVLRTSSAGPAAIAVLNGALGRW
jgi:16S rRNA (uracil1498-N3)-methyltransferase